MPSIVVAVHPRAFAKIRGKAVQRAESKRLYRGSTRKHADFPKQHDESSVKLFGEPKRFCRTADPTVRFAHNDVCRHCGSMPMPHRVYVIDPRGEHGTYGAREKQQFANALDRVLAKALRA